MDDELYNEQELPSRSQRKRDMQVYKELGNKLVSMSEGDLARVPLTAILAEAVAIGRRIKSSDAKRRQINFIAKQLRLDEENTVANAVASIDLHHSQQINRFHQLELLRDNLLAQGEPAIDQVLERYPDAERNRLRQLVRAASKEAELQQPPKSARKLFKYLRELDQHQAL